MAAEFGVQSFASSDEGFKIDILFFFCLSWFKQIAIGG